ncbi:diguanylate cyclase domain-containing protein [Lachnoclostridium sp. An169]|uniref:diguanylate cyclase domain-containing protein n=1 Tax=Lachnoclostridium sp. An169 TaxID=1965569 RepID=UPI0013A60F72|nr:diguanylate cyclase [Lachnoclostridium sp. An169]
MTDNLILKGTDIKKKVEELTGYLLHKHYCENDPEAIIRLFDDRFSWFGTGEYEYATGTETVTEIFQTFSGKVPRCIISDEQYDVLEISPDAYLCTGRLWISTDPATNVYLRVHQRVSTVFRICDGRAWCCHIHISNPYVEMAPDDVGFPTRMAKQSYEYLRECVETQSRQIREQTEKLERMSFEDGLTGLFNRNRFNEEMENDAKEYPDGLGVAYFDINGLKAVNDHFGHRAGDDLICRTAHHISSVFAGKTYRIGGDEFVVVVTDMSGDDFRQGLADVHSRMKNDGIKTAIGYSWREEGCNAREQFEEADREMYADKARFYSGQKNDKRRK